MVAGMVVGMDTRRVDLMVSVMAVKWVAAKVQRSAGMWEQKMAAHSVVLKEAKTAVSMAGHSAKRLVGLKGCK
jgi:hypothetical protein